MSEAAKALAEFHDFFGYDHPFESARLRLSLISEEYDEVVEELRAAWTVGMNYDRKKLYKELADLVYVCYGLDAHMGGRLDEVFAEVHRANMTKLWDCEDCDGSGEEPFGPTPRIAIAVPCKACDGTGKIVKKREDGKVLKPPTYEKADLSFLDEETT